MDNCQKKKYHNMSMLLYPFLKSHGIIENIEEKKTKSKISLNKKEKINLSSKNDKKIKKFKTIIATTEKQSNFKDKFLRRNSWLSENS